MKAPFDFGTIPFKTLGPPGDRMSGREKSKKSPSRQVPAQTVPIFDPHPREGPKSLNLDPTNHDLWIKELEVVAQWL